MRLMGGRRYDEVKAVIPAGTTVRDSLNNSVRGEPFD